MVVVSVLTVQLPLEYRFSTGLGALSLAAMAGIMAWDSALLAFNHLDAGLSRGTLIAAEQDAVIAGRAAETLYRMRLELEHNDRELREVQDAVERYRALAHAVRDEVPLLTTLEEMQAKNRRTSLAIASGSFVAGALVTVAAAVLL